MCVLGRGLSGRTGMIIYVNRPVNQPTNTQPSSPYPHNTQLFVLSVLLSCTLRCLSFVAIGALDVQSIALHDGDGPGPASQPSMDAGPEDPDTQFYEKVRCGGGWLGLGIVNDVRYTPFPPPQPPQINKQQSPPKNKH